MRSKAKLGSLAVGLALLAGAGLGLAGCGGGGSGASGGTTTVTVPGAPTIGAATAGSGTATIAFTAPASNGGAPITSYTATCTAAGASVTAVGAMSPVFVSGLTNGATYSCAIAAANSVGLGPPSSAVSVALTLSASTASVDCPYSENIYETTVGTTSIANWTCASGRRILAANGLPDHPIGTFPNPSDANFLSAQTVNFSATLTPTLASTANTSSLLVAYDLNGVRFDPLTTGTCPNTVTATSDCKLTGGTGPWKIEALGQKTFSFGADANNGHVQSGGVYAYFGVPEGVMTRNGSSAATPKMVLLGFAPDGYPIYGRWGHSTATDSSSALKVMTSSYAVKTTPDSGRPSTTLVPLGVFTQDYRYVAGSGDLDECNARLDVTPEFPKGVYHYYATDSFPFLPRCWNGVIK